MHTSYPRISAIFADGSRALHITILLTLSIPPGEAELPVWARYNAYLHPEPPGPDTVIWVFFLVKIGHNDVFSRILSWFSSVFPIL